MTAPKQRTASDALKAQDPSKADLEKLASKVDGEQPPVDETKPEDIATTLDAPVSPHEAAVLEQEHDVHDEKVTGNGDVKVKVIIDLFGYMDGDYPVTAQRGEVVEIDAKQAERGLSLGAVTTEV